MGYMKTVELECDADGCFEWWSGDGMWKTATAARKQARGDGWVNDGAEDYCPEHSHLVSK